MLLYSLAYAPSSGDKSFHRQTCDGYQLLSEGLINGRGAKGEFRAKPSFKCPSFLDLRMPERLSEPEASEGVREWVAKIETGF
jgi:hypothetical protein